MTSKFPAPALELTHGEQRGTLSKRSQSHCFRGRSTARQQRGRSRTVRFWEALGGKLPFRSASSGKVCLSIYDPIVVVRGTSVAARNLSFPWLPTDGRAGAVFCLSGSGLELVKADVLSATPSRNSIEQIFLGSVQQYGTSRPNSAPNWCLDVHQDGTFECEPARPQHREVKGTGRPAAAFGGIAD